MGMKHVLAAVALGLGLALVIRSTGGLEVLTAPDAEKTAIEALQAETPALTLRGPQDGVLAVGVSSDGERAMAVTGDGRIWEWRLKDGSVLLKADLVPGKKQVWSSGGLVAETPDGNLIVAQAQDGSLATYDRKTGALVKVLSGPEAEFLISANGRTVGWTTTNWKNKNGTTRLATFPRGEERTVGMKGVPLALSDDGQWLAWCVWPWGSGNHTFSVEESGSGKVAWQKMVDTPGATFGAITPDGRTLAGVGGAGLNALEVGGMWGSYDVRLLDSTGGAAAFIEVRAFVNDPAQVAFSPSGKTLAVPTARGVDGFDLATRTVKQRLTLIDPKEVAGLKSTGQWEAWNDMVLNGVAFTPDGKRILVAKGKTVVVCNNPFP
jgi:WD40 repeat protein